MPCVLGTNHLEPIQPTGYISRGGHLRGKGDDLKCTESGKIYVHPRPEESHSWNAKLGKSVRQVDSEGEGRHSSDSSSGSSILSRRRFCPTNGVVRAFALLLSPAKKPEFIHDQSESVVRNIFGVRDLGFPVRSWRTVPSGALYTRSVKNRRPRSGHLGWTASFFLTLLQKVDMSKCVTSSCPTSLVDDSILW